MFELINSLKPYPHLGSQTSPLACMVTIFRPWAQ
jgi:hypothetical protein